MAKDYYDILGISKSASQEEIKSAYKKLAKKYHPDLNKGDKVSENKFKEISEAYKVLGDQKSRSNYDRFGSADPSGAGFGGFGGFNSGDFGGFDINDIFNDFFGGGFGGGSRSNRRRSTRGSDLRYDIEITLEEAFKGKKIKVEIPRMEVCDRCNGSGAFSEGDIHECSNCNGTGTERVTKRTPFGMFSQTTTCHICHGSGKKIERVCPECDGSGYVEKVKNLEVSIPPGVDNESRLRVSGEGEVGQNGGPRGDFYVFISVKEHDVFKREGDNINIEIPISFVQAALGDEVEVPTLDGKAKMKIPPGTQSETIFRLKEKGMPRINSSLRGSQYVKVSVAVPEKLNTKQKDLLKEYDKISKDRFEYKSFFDKIKNAFK